MSEVHAHPRSVRVVTSPRAADRVETCVAWLTSGGKAAPALVIGATQEAASEVVRRATTRSGASFGWHRTTLPGLAADLAREGLGSASLTPASALGLEALCARIVAELAADGALGRFAPVAHLPGLPRALARTLQDLRLAGVAPGQVPRDLARLAERFHAALGAAGLADRATVIDLAVKAVRGGAWAPVRTVLVDVPVPTPVEAALVAALAGRASDVLATCPDGDARTLAHLSKALGRPAEALPHGTPDALARLQAALFSPEAVERGERGDAVVLLSAPGESRECVEIARRIHREAAAGVPFDRIALLLHAPAAYRAHVGEALRRAGIPTWQARGTRSPDPAGRALLALLACRAEGLSARRFAEYLSLGEVPEADAAGAPPLAAPAAERHVAPDDEVVPEGLARAEAEMREAVGADPPVVAGTLRAPRNWEQILVDAAVIGGLDRWERRLAGWRAQLEMEQAHTEEGDDAHRQGLARRIAEVNRLRAYAMPLLQALDALPTVATWGRWLEALGDLCSRALRHPERVLGVLAELVPMGPVGPVGLDEVRLVLAPRLSELVGREVGRPYGRVFVGPIDAARGLDFDVVFVPGLAERLFPGKVVEDPMLLDTARAGLPELERQEDRVALQRLALRLAIGAATRRVVLSWPRVEAEKGRPRVPSFYGLEVVRAAEGVLPGFEELARKAEAAAAVRLGWPAPADPADAIDDAEHDLALLRLAFGGERRKGVARYLVEANEHLARALRARHMRWGKEEITRADGLVRPRPEALEALKAHHLGARSFSATALQNYTACPYRFLLQAVHRLAPREEPVAVEHVDPLSRGSLIHEVQYGVLTRLQDENALPVRPAGLDHALERLDTVLAEVEARYRDRLAPAIDRVWQDEMGRIRADLREWLRRESEDADWTPWRFELAFGLPWQAGRDDHSHSEAVPLDAGIQLRGSIDLVEVNDTGRLRVTDYKTGKASFERGALTQGMSALQPVLYALAAEKMFPDRTVVAGRLYYSTNRGEYSERVVPLDAEARDQVVELVGSLGPRLERGDLPAWPRKGECAYCEYLAVCGPREPERTEQKSEAGVQDLLRLRGMR